MLAKVHKEGKNQVGELIKIKSKLSEAVAGKARGETFWSASATTLGRIRMGNMAKILETLMSTRTSCRKAIVINFL